MKKNLTRAVVYITLGAGLLTAGLLATQEWTSFALGASVPMILGGLFSGFKYIKERQDEAQAGN